MAFTDIPKTEYDKMLRENNNFAAERDREILESDLTIAAIFALKDPLRDEIPYSAKQCRSAGITIRMVTGDNIDTAKAIALDAGILTPEETMMEYSCMEGKRFREEVGGLVRIDDGGE